MAALILRAKYGGSYHVRTSLSRFSMWYSDLGVFDRAYMLDTIRKPEHQHIPLRLASRSTARSASRSASNRASPTRRRRLREVPGHPTVVPIGASEAEWLPY